MGQMIELLSLQGLMVIAHFATALVIFFAGRWAAGILSRLLYKILKRVDVETTLARFAENLAHGALLMFVILAALERLGVNTISVAAVLAASGLAIGLALKDSLSNFAAGVMLMLFHPFEVGDFVSAGGSSGVIEEIDIFHTVMRTRDNIQIIIPNGKITNNTIDNFTANPTRRIDLIVGCGYSDDLRAVKRFLEDLLAGDDRILNDPAPVIAVNELGAKSVDFVVRPWVKSDDYWTVRWDLIERVKLGFDERGFGIPDPSRNVVMHTAARE